MIKTGPDPWNYRQVVLCLACADRDCHSCYGGQCDCSCRGEETAGGALGCVYCSRDTSVVDIPEDGGVAHYACWQQTQVPA